MGKIVVVGSGASGVHFALTALRKGHEVLMLDVGHTRPAAAGAGMGLHKLKQTLDDPVAYFLGPRFEAVTYGDSQSDFYSFPPSKRHVFSEPPRVEIRKRGFEPLLSFARGGLGEVWTAGVYPFNDDELADYPFAYRDIAPYYEEVARRIGISGEDDELSRFMPFHDGVSSPLKLDQHSNALLSAYTRRKSSFAKRLGCYMGRSRVAVLTHDDGNRKKCSYTGRCIWGCPEGAFYTPSLTLEECRRHSNFTYVPNMHVSHFACNGGGQVRSVAARPIDGGNEESFSADRIALAAGTMCTARIYLESVRRESGQYVELHGLMDNRQVLAPFVNPRMIAKAYDPDSYQYHLLAMGLTEEQPRDYVHAQITCLTTALAHPIIQKIPMDLQVAAGVFRNARCGLGVLNLNFRDTPRRGNMITLEPNGRAGARLVVCYEPEADEACHISRTMKRVRRALLQLGCFVAPGTVRVRQKGQSVHYAGTLPMTTQPRPHATTPWCESHEYAGLYIVDGSTFPFLPAKNITFTLMANAVRVGGSVF